MSLRQILIAEILFGRIVLFCGVFFGFVLVFWTFFFSDHALSLALFHQVFRKRGRRRERWRDCVKFLLMHNVFKYCTFWIDATNQLRNDSCFVLTHLQ